MLGRTMITDAGLDHVKRSLLGLLTLEVDETAVTNRGVRELQRVMPQLQVHR